jgi:hypothetical protein
VGPAYDCRQMGSELLYPHLALSKPTNKHHLLPPFASGHYEGPHGTVLATPSVDTSTSKTLLLSPWSTCRYGDSEMIWWRRDVCFLCLFSTFALFCLFMVWFLSLSCLLYWHPPFVSLPATRKLALASRAFHEFFPLRFLFFNMGQRQIRRSRFYLYYNFKNIQLIHIRYSFK